MMQQNYDIPLHDIKPIIEVQEYSIYYFFALVAVAVLVALGVIFLVLRWFRGRKRFNLRKHHQRLLKELDISDAKAAAYALTLYGETFANDSQRHTQMYANLVARLEGYKYKKSVESFDSETLSYINIYKEMCDV
ncbi:MAG: hypothetical protein IE916_11185 [Epsilonproteobacteria bacterium]|nr:hypothetical protein [Campylobacterota bacterium]